jgi:AraC-like DNA-binding protein
MNTECKNLWGSPHKKSCQLEPQVVPILISHAKVKSDWCNEPGEKPSRLHHLHFAIAGSARWRWQGGGFRLKPGNAYLAPANCPIWHSCSLYYEHCVIILNLFASGTNIELFPDLKAPLNLGRWNKKMLERLMSTRLAHKSFMLLSSEIIRLLANSLPKLEKRIAQAAFFQGELGKALRMIDERPSMKWRMSDLSKACSLSIKIFSQRLMKATGHSPKSYVGEAIVKRACALLVTSSMTVKEIALTLDFNDEHYFSRFFTKKCGISPIRYRGRFRTNISI